MRNPIRWKNLNGRFLPYYLLGLALLILHPPDRRGLLLAIAPIAVGLAIRSWGAGHLVKNEALSTGGPYAHLRHPLYLGTLLIGTGFAIAVGGVVTLVVLAVLWPWFGLHYFPRKEALEAARLEDRYGERFRRYREAVPALWPRLAAWQGGSAGSETRWDLARYSENNELGTLLAVGSGFLAFWLRASVTT